MSAVWLIFELAINVFLGWLYSWFLDRQLTPRNCRSRLRATCMRVGIILIVAGFYSLYLLFDLEITDTVVFVFTFIYSLQVFSDPLRIKLLWNIILSVTVLAVATLVSQVFMSAVGLSWDTLMQPSAWRVGYVLCANITLLAVCYVITRLRRTQEHLSRVSLILFVILNAVLLLALEMQYNLSWRKEVPNTPVLVTIFCVLFVIAGLMVMFEMLSYSAEKQADLEIKIESTHMLESRMDEVRVMHQQMMEYEHDVKHHLNTLQAMIDAGKLSEGQAYLDELAPKLRFKHIFTGCVAVDALLSVKQAYMEQQHISFIFSPYPLDEMPISASDMCALLGNLLDNAIEAIQRIPNKTKEYEIRLSFSRSKGMFFISCRNETGGMIIRRRGQKFLSSKRKERVGYGLTSVRSRVEQADGSADFRVENETFIAEIALPFRREAR